MQKRIENDATKEAWLAERKKYVTATQAATVMGRNPFKTRQGLAQEKLGLIPDFEGNQLTWMGSHYESANCDAFRRVSGYDAVLTDEFVVRAPLACTLDGRTTSVGRSLDTPVQIEWLTQPPPVGRECVLELKNVQAKSDWFWKKGPPEMYWWQVQCQLYCTGLTNGLIVAKVDAHRLLAAHIEADTFAQEELVERATEFLENLEEIANGSRK